MHLSSPRSLNTNSLGIAWGSLDGISSVIFLEYQKCNFPYFFTILIYIHIIERLLRYPSLFVGTYTSANQLSQRNLAAFDSPSLYLTCNRNHRLATKNYHRSVRSRSLIGYILLGHNIHGLTLKEKQPCYTKLIVQQTSVILNCSITSGSPKHSSVD
jgi:hypothetical protein